MLLYPHSHQQLKVAQIYASPKQMFSPCSHPYPTPLPPLPSLTPSLRPSITLSHSLTPRLRHRGVQLTPLASLPQRLRLSRKKTPQHCVVSQGGLPCWAPHGCVAKCPGVGQVRLSEGLVHTICIAGWDEALQPRA